MSRIALGGFTEGVSPLEMAQAFSIFPNLVGYTPELVTAVWVGYNKNDPNFVMQSSGGDHPAKILRKITNNYERSRYSS